MAPARVMPRRGARFDAPPRRRLARRNNPLEDIREVILSFKYRLAMPN
jgi:hypothetical protein